MYRLLKQWRVAPQVGAWIEISNGILTVFKSNVAPQVGVWIEIQLQRYIRQSQRVAPQVRSFLIFLLSLIVIFCPERVENCCF